MNRPVWAIISITTWWTTTYLLGLTYEVAMGGSFGIILGAVMCPDRGG